MAKVYSNRFAEYTNENGGRVLLLFLLFLLAIYEFIHAGYSTFSVVCISPVLIIAVYVTFKWKMAAFWALIVINYIIQFKGNPFLLPSGVPMSLWDEALELLLIGIAILDASEESRFGRSVNLMFFAISIWCSFCTLELLNDTCDLGIDVSAWFTSFRLYCLHLVWILLVFSIYISTPERLIQYLKVWALLSLFSAFWTWKQKNIGFTPREYAFIYYGAGRSTHLLNGGSLIRYFSTFSDAATYGCYAASTGVAFIIFAITSKVNWDRIFFLVIGVCVIWGMFQSGTRTAIFSMAAGFMLYIILSKSFKIAIPFGVFFAFFMSILVVRNKYYRYTIFHSW